MRRALFGAIASKGWPVSPTPSNTLNSTLSGYTFGNSGVFTGGNVLCTDLSIDFRDNPGITGERTFRLTVWDASASVLVRTALTPVVFTSNQAATTLTIPVLTPGLLPANQSLTVGVYQDGDGYPARSASNGLARFTTAGRSWGASYSTGKYQAGDNFPATAAEGWGLIPVTIHGTAV